MNTAPTMTILLAEDNAVIGEALRDHLLADGWRVDWSTGLQAAKCAVDRTIYALVLLDLHFPEGSGLDLLRHIHKQSPFVPIIILSAYDQISDRMKGLQAGAVDFLVKPFDLDEMIVRVRRCLKPTESKQVAEAFRLLVESRSLLGAQRGSGSKISRGDAGHFGPIAPSLDDG